MNLNLNSVFYKIFFLNIDTRKKEFFVQLCDWLFSFSDNNDPKTIIKGLTLQGFRYFKNIYYSNINEISEEELTKIDRITPIIEVNYFPFIYYQNCLEILNSNKNRDKEKLINFNVKIDKHLKSWLNNNQPPKKYNQRIETHLSYPLVKNRNLDLYSEIPKLLPEGQYECIPNNNKSENIEIPDVDNILKSIITNPLNFSAINIDYNNRILRLINNKKNKLIIKPLYGDQVGFSFYSYDVGWFNKLLSRYQKNVLSSPHRKIPNMY